LFLQSDLGVDMTLDAGIRWFVVEKDRSGLNFQLTIHLDPKEVGEVMCGEVDSSQDRIGTKDQTALGKLALSGTQTSPAG
jgi:hypothetical protein